MPASTITTTSVTVIQEIDAQRLKSNYKEKILITPEDQSIADVFRWNSGEVQKTLIGFSITVSDFLEIVSYVGVTRYMVSFGLEDTQPISRPPFTLIIQGINNDRSIKSLLYKLTTPIYMEDTTLVQSFYSEKVPEILGTKWGEKWETIVEQEQIPSSLCEISVNSNIQVLEGYCFNRADFIDTLFPENVSDSNEQPNNVLFCFTSNNYRKNSNDIEPTNIIGLMIGSITSDLESLSPIRLLSSFYDFSAPCPPTCP